MSRKTIIKQGISLLNNHSNTINKEVLSTLVVGQLRCNICNSKLLHIYDSCIVECKCKKCKALNYHKVNKQ